MSAKQAIRVEVRRAGDLLADTGVLVPADPLSQARLRAKAYRMGDVVRAQLKKDRNPGFHRLAHRIAALVGENVDGFEGLDAHAVLKRLQLESGAGCDEVAVLDADDDSPFHLDRHPTRVVRVPRSLSFDVMDEAEFQSVMRSICEHIVRAYWPDTTVEDIEDMAEEAERYRQW